MRQYGTQLFEVNRLIPQRQLESAKFNARQWAKEDARRDAFKSITDYYGDDLAHAMTHIKRWREVTEDHNIWPHPDEPDDYKPDLRLRVFVIVEGFDVV